jgi:dTDP-4-amino-4,6-dideoxygalactose transaminase
MDCVPRLIITAGILDNMSNLQSPSKRILACDPGANYRARRAEIDAAIQRVVESGWYILGPDVEAFEREFANYLGTGYAVGVGSGTDGLHLALRACDVRPGDGVATVSHTAVATVAAVEMAGALPILVDVDPATYTMDPQSLENALARQAVKSPRIKAVVPVHLYGQPADLASILQIAGNYGIPVVEDCAQSHGAEFNGKKAGAWGAASVFSLYPTKNLGALGDAGVVCTNDERIAERLRRLRQYGWKQRSNSEIPGFNSRLDELQAAVLRVKLGYLDADNAARRAIAAKYTAQMEGLEISLPSCRSGATHVFHQYVIRCRERDRLQARLAEQQINSLIHYPLPVHRQTAYAGRLPQLVPLNATESLVGEILSLPMYPELSFDSAIQVADAVREALN